MSRSSGSRTPIGVRVTRITVRSGGAGGDPKEVAATPGGTKIHVERARSEATAPEPPVRARSWPLERILFGMAGSVTLISAGLTLLSPWFLLLTVFVGLSQWSYVVVGVCPASFVLERRGFRRVAEWRRRAGSGQGQAT